MKEYLISLKLIIFLKKTLILIPHNDYTDSELKVKVVFSLLYI